MIIFVPMANEEKLILVTNDDSVNAKGIHALVSVAKQLGRVIVVAPDKPQSGMGHAITLSDPIRINKIDIFPGVEAYSCSGTPVDCVKIAIYEILKRKPDVVLSGINHGENSSTNVLYSGTMSAAIEGAMEGLPSIGFSLSNFDPEADFSHGFPFIKNIIEKVLQEGLPKNTCLNVNIPDGLKHNIKGVKVCVQAHAFWADRFDRRDDQFGRPYFWLTGAFDEVNPVPNSDLHALQDGYISIVPTHFDLTNYNALEQIKSWNL
jgi:5'-nucleotidase